VRGLPEADFVAIVDFEEVGDFLGEVALEFDGAALDRAADAEGLFEVGAQGGKVVADVLQAGDEGDLAVAFASFGADAGDLVGRGRGIFVGEHEARVEAFFGRVGHLLHGWNFQAPAGGLGQAARRTGGGFVEWCAGKESGHGEYDGRSGGRRQGELREGL
jgi:hypothetical protein